jgi:hypothetical protein
VGELDKLGGAPGFVVGLAPLDCRPPPVTADALARKSRAMGPAAFAAPAAGTGAGGSPPGSPPGGGLALCPSGPPLLGGQQLSRKGSALAELAGSGGGAGCETNALFVRFKHETPQVRAALLLRRSRRSGGRAGRARAAAARRVWECRCRAPLTGCCLPAQGQQLNEQLKAEQQRLREARVVARDLSMAVNQAKQDIEAAQQQAPSQQAGAEGRLAAARAGYR